MKKIIEKYGDAIVATVVMMALGAILVTALASDGYVAVAFRQAVEGLFARMMAITPGAAPTP